LFNQIVVEELSAIRAKQPTAKTITYAPIGYVLEAAVVVANCPLSVPFEQSMPAAVSTAI
jgi:hypothetical protein